MLISKNFKQKLRHQEVETEALRAEVIQKLPLPYPWCIYKLTEQRTTFK